MKKLNRKGFTLIELLAVIVILGIIMVIAIPSFINSVDSAREEQFQNAVDSVSKWMTMQYKQMQLEYEAEPSYMELYNKLTFTSPISINYLDWLRSDATATVLRTHANSFFGGYSYQKVNALKYNISNESKQVLKDAGITNVEVDICTEDNGNDTKCSRESYAHYSGFRLQDETICVRLCAKEGGTFWTNNSDHCKFSTGCITTDFNLIDWVK